MDHDSDHVPLEMILAKPTYKQTIPEWCQYEGLKN